MLNDDDDGFFSVFVIVLVSLLNARCQRTIDLPFVNISVYMHASI